jgi:hypothetical protein
LAGFREQVVSLYNAKIHAFLSAGCSSQAGADFFDLSLHIGLFGGSPSALQHSITLIAASGQLIFGRELYSKRRFNCLNF